MKKPDSKALRLLEREPEPELQLPIAEIDAAESRWDPWLLALAKIEALEQEPRPN